MKKKSLKHYTIIKERAALAQAKRLNEEAAIEQSRRDGTFGLKELQLELEHKYVTSSLCADSLWNKAYNQDSEVFQSNLEEIVRFYTESSISWVNDDSNPFHPDLLDRVDRRVSLLQQVNDVITGLIEVYQFQTKQPISTKFETKISLLITLTTNKVKAIGREASQTNEDFDLESLW